MRYPRHSTSVRLVVVPDAADYFVHPSAWVDEGAVVGAGTKIWHFCHVMSGARIGQDCSFGQNCFVADGAVVGARVRVQNNVSLFSGVHLEDDVFCGPSVVFTNVKRPRAFVSKRLEYATTRVGHGATLGANASILPGLSLGCYSFVAAGAVVTRDVRAFELVLGQPARFAGWVSRHGERLNFDEHGRAACPVTGEAYQLVNGAVERA